MLYVFADLVKCLNKSFEHTLVTDMLVSFNPLLIKLPVFVLDAGFAPFVLVVALGGLSLLTLSMELRLIPAESLIGILVKFALDLRLRICRGLLKCTFLEVWAAGRTSSSWDVKHAPVV